MDQALPGKAAIPFEARVAGRLTVGFMLDIGELGRGGRSMLDAMLIAAITDANVNRLNRQPALQMSHARLDTPPPDELRRPVSINALAASLRLPFETVRRHVNKLAREGFVVAGPSGLQVPTRLLSSPSLVAAMRQRYVRVFRFYEDLREGGAVEPLPSPPAADTDPQAPIRAVNRILSDYFFRTLDALHRTSPDPVTAMILLAIVYASTEHLTGPAAIDLMRAGWIGDQDRKPVRVAQISRRLAVPYETTRRHVGELVERGLCRREGAGVLLAAGHLERPSLLGDAVDNLTNVRRMFRQIAALETEDAAAGLVGAPD